VQDVEDKYSQMAIALLGQLVTERGIFASLDKGWSGAFHSWFGRDSAITADLIFAAESSGQKSNLSEKAYEALIHLGHWQGLVDDPTTGEEIGKIPHEIRTTASHNEQTEERAEEFQNLWTYYPDKHASINWDSVDSTPLWVLAIARWHRQSDLQYKPETLRVMRAALEWCLHNLQQYNGLAGFIGADEQPQRKGGLHNQGWKDSQGVYQQADGSLAKQPIFDVFVNGIFWAALRSGAAAFTDSDAPFSATLQQAATALKQRWNDPAKGFLVPASADSPNYFAAALDGDGKQLEATAVDPALCLWADFDGECVIEDRFVTDVVRRVMMPDMLNSDAGMRNYASSVKVPKIYTGGYHRGPNTYWPFVSGLLAKGFRDFGFTKEANQVGMAALAGISHFDSCIEMFKVPRPGIFTSWQDARGEQRSSTDQAWTAAALYYLAAFSKASLELAGSRLTTQDAPVEFFIISGHYVAGEVPFDTFAASCRIDFIDLLHVFLEFRLIFG
jgi:glycogen debranching enzyme